MKTSVFFLLFNITLFSLAQNQRFISTYKRESGAFKNLMVPMSFDSDSITRPKSGARIGQVYRIDYVATSFNHSVNAYQKNLDQARWIQLYNYTGIKKAPEIETNIFYQTSAKNEEEAKKLFHGFMVYYQEPEEALHYTAMSALPNMMGTIAGQKITDETKSIDIKKPTIVLSQNVGDITKYRKNEITQELTKDNMIVEWEYDSIGMDKRYYNAVYHLSKVSAGVFVAYKALQDVSLLEVFRRLKTEKNTLIVTDMTGSMMPYYAQLLMWHALRAENKRLENYIFFNDGDNKKSSDKVIGNTGGLYSVYTNNLLSVYRTMNLCMKNGGGGDLPENNFEAVLHGLNKNDSIERVILICDNWAVPRDVELLEQIEVPIDFVMCGATLGVNKQYLNLVRENKGRLHTVEKSISNLGTKDIGEKFTIGSRKYSIGKKGIEEEL